MNHSTIQQAVMYGLYNGIKQTFNTDDVSGIQSVYGPVAADTTNNGQIATATNITSLIDSNAQIAYTGEAITSATNQDFFQVTVPSNTTGSMTVSIQATNLSSLAPRVTVYNASGQGLAQAMNANGYGTTATLTINNVSPGQVYYIRATAANTGAGSVGSYGLLVNFGSAAQAPIPGLTTVVASQSDAGGGSSAETIGPRRSWRWGPGKQVLDGISDDSGVVHFGTLSGYGDELMASVRRFGKHRPHRAPHPAHAHLRPRLHRHFH
jgi:hypothetical protein